MDYLWISDAFTTFNYNIRNDYEVTMEQLGVMSHYN